MTPHVIKEEMEFNKFIDTTLHFVSVNKLTMIFYHQLADRYFNTQKMIKLYKLFCDIDEDNTGELTIEKISK